MTVLLLDIQDTFDDLTRSIKWTSAGLTGLQGNFTKTAGASKELQETLKQSSNSLTKLVSSGKLIAGLGIGFVAVTELATKFTSAIQLTGQEI